MQARPKIAIIGGGISGLAAAFQCQKKIPDCQVAVLEKNERVGGVLRTEVRGGYLIEHSADMFTTDPPDALDFCRQIGRHEHLITTQDVPAKAYVASTDSIHPVPAGFSLMLPGRLDTIEQSKLLDEDGKRRLFAERDIPPTSVEDESLQSFAVRRFGTQAFDRLIQPLVSGIYTADPEKLSMRATLKRFLDMEQQYGSLIKAAEAKKSSADSAASGARYGLFRAPKDGMQCLADWLIDSSTGIEIRPKTSVKALQKTGDGKWNLKLQNSSDELFDSVIIACPANPASRILRECAANLSQELGEIETASSAIVVLGFETRQLGNPFSGFGIVFPHCLGRQAIALSFSSNKFANRAPAGRILIRCFVGGALQSELLRLEDEQLKKIALDEIQATVGIEGAPELADVFRWNNCMPQYHLGHLDRVQRIESLVSQLPGLEIAGNSYHGVGVPVCLRSGFSAADRVIANLEISH